MNHQLTDTKALTALEPAGPLPDWLARLNVPDDQIRDLTWTGRTDQGYWPVTVTAPAFDPEAEILTDLYGSYTVDGEAKVWRAVLAKRALTPEEIAARNPVPASVTPAQACIILAEDGLLRRVEAIVAAMPEAVQIWFARANTWERANPYVWGIGLELDLSDDDLDEMFRRAARRL